MFWMTRPPYLRWAMAAAIIVLALAWDLRDSAEAPYPFASEMIAAGTVITDELVEWRSLPAGLMTTPDLSNPVASRDIEAGEPIVASAVSDDTLIPNGWWSVPIALPSVVPPGTRVRLIGMETPLDIEGVVVSGGSDDLLSFSEAGTVAVPSEVAPDVAIAAVNGTLVVLLEP